MEIRCRSALALPQMGSVKSSMELSSADQIEQEFADELQSMSLQEEEAAPIKKPVLERGFSEIDPHNEAAARGTSAQKQGSFSARQLPDEPSYRVALQSRYGSVAPPLARTFTERDPSSPISPPPKVAPAAGADLHGARAALPADGASE